MTKETAYIDLCKNRIEEKLGWGNSSEWTNQDFEKLSGAIQKETAVCLSVTTLKRIWGKVKYDSLPAITTLNTLAQFVDYADWHSFKQQAQATTNSPEKQAPVHTAEITAPIAQRKKQPVHLWRWSAAVLVAVVILPGFLYLKKDNEVLPNPDRSQYAFTSKKVITKGVPNSVVFHYNAAAAPTDSVVIQQSWDVRRNVTVSKNNTDFTSIYYYPGYFKAKLVVGNTAVQAHDLFVLSDGWMAAITQEPVPVYLKKEDVETSNGLAVTPNTIKKYNLQAQPHPQKIVLSNVQELPGLRNDNFTFEALVKNDFNEGAAACQHVGVMILCKNDVIMLPLTAKGCVGEMAFYAAGTTVRSTEADLSKLGCDLSQWTKVRIESRNKTIRYMVNGTEAVSLPMKNLPSDIVGVTLTFEGAAAVRYARFFNGTTITLL